MKRYFLLLPLLLLSGCENKPMTTVYDKSILNKKLPCLQLSVMPEDKHIRFLLTSCLLSLFQKFGYLLGGVITKAAATG